MSNTASLYDIGQHIKNARWAKNWTMKTLADEAGIKDATLIARIENGSTKVSDSTLELLAKTLDTTLEYIKTGVIPEQPKQPILTSSKLREYMLNHIPVNPGDTIYYKSPVTGELTPFTVKECICEIKCDNENGHITFDLRTLGKNLFLSKEDAENTPDTN